MACQSLLFLLRYVCKWLVRAGKFASFVAIHDHDHRFGAKQEKIRVLIGLDAAPLLRKLLPNTRIILFTVQEGTEVERLARAAGIHAVVSKNEAASKLILRAQVLLASIKHEHHPAKLRDAS